MGFLSPKPKKPDPPANSPILARESSGDITDALNLAPSLITTGAQGLKRKANTQRTSLIGG